MLDGIRNESIS